VGTIGSIISAIIGGAIIGGLARLAVPGKQQIGLAITIILGIVGSLIGYFIAGALGVDSTKGIDWIRLIISIAAAAGLVIAYVRFAGGRQIGR
jgi:uncharacterized membrane protein YeaQ/YmgE (transglycosylase-associated protein family)